MIEINFTPFPVLNTAHFFLRPLEKSDAPEIFALRSSDEINKYLNRQKAQSMEDALQFIEKIREGLAKNESILWVIADKKNLHFTGTICLWKISAEESNAEIGYELLPEYHGKGIMQEVIPVIVDYAFQTLKLHSLEAELSPRNIRSAKLLERNHFSVKSEDSSGENADSVIYVLKNAQTEK